MTIIKFGDSNYSDGEGTDVVAAFAAAAQAIPDEEGTSPSTIESEVEERPVGRDLLTPEEAAALLAAVNDTDEEIVADLRADVGSDDDFVEFEPEPELRIDFDSKGRGEGIFVKEILSEPAATPEQRAEAQTSRLRRSASEAITALNRAVKQAKGLVDIGGVRQLQQAAKVARDAGNAPFAARDYQVAAAHATRARELADEALARLHRLQKEAQERRKAEAAVEEDLDATISEIEAEEAAQAEATAVKAEETEADTDDGDDSDEAERPRRDPAEVLEGLLGSPKFASNEAFDEVRELLAVSQEKAEAGDDKAARQAVTLAWNVFNDVQASDGLGQASTMLAELGEDHPDKGFLESRRAALAARREAADPEDVRASQTLREVNRDTHELVRAIARQLGDEREAELARENLDKIVETVKGCGGYEICREHSLWEEVIDQRPITFRDRDSGEECEGIKRVIMPEGDHVDDPYAPTVQEEFQDIEKLLAEKPYQAAKRSWGLRKLVRRRADELEAEERSRVSRLAGHSGGGRTDRQRDRAERDRAYRKERQAAGLRHSGDGGGKKGRGKRN